jgi:hypothetical protein
MSEAASDMVFASRLRVAVHADDPRRRQALGKAVTEAGHMVVDGHDAPDVVLADGSHPSNEARNVVGLGIVDERLRGALPREADARQIDAAIRVDRSRGTAARQRVWRDARKRSSGLVDAA